MRYIFFREKSVRAFPENEISTQSSIFVAPQQQRRRSRTPNGPALALGLRGLRGRRGRPCEDRTRRTRQGPGKYETLRAELWQAVELQRAQEEDPRPPGGDSKDAREQGGISHILIQNLPKRDKKLIIHSQRI